MRLLEIGYSKTCLKKAYKKSLEKNRCELLYSQKSKSEALNDNATRLIISYSNQHNKISNVIQKCWHLLSMDLNLGKFVPTKPLIPFKRATSIRDRIIQSEFKSENRNDPCKAKGTYTCVGCSYCQYIEVGSTCALPNGRSFRAAYYANYNTKGVVYLLSCDCGSFYVGNTKVELRSRMTKHV